MRLELPDNNQTSIWMFVVCKASLLQPFMYNNKKYNLSIFILLCFFWNTRKDWGVKIWALDLDVPVQMPDHHLYWEPSLATPSCRIHKLIQIFRWLSRYLTHHLLNPIFLSSEPFDVSRLWVQVQQFTFFKLLKKTNFEQLCWNWKTGQ